MSGVDWNTVFNTLSNEYRRRLLVNLIEHNPQDDSVDIPDDIVIGDKERDLLQAEMVHTHLPKLEAAGYIQWEKDTHEVMKGPRFDEIRPLLELIYEHRDDLPDGWL
jgi:hypothetical protein